jgi:hypothetical protein
MASPWSCHICLLSASFCLISVSYLPLPVSWLVLLISVSYLSLSTTICLISASFWLSSVDVWWISLFQFLIIPYALFVCHCQLLTCGSKYESNVCLVVCITICLHMSLAIRTTPHITVLLSYLHSNHLLLNLENWDLIRRPPIEYTVYDHNRRPSFNPISYIMHSTIASPRSSSNCLYSRVYSSGDAY